MDDSPRFLDVAIPSPTLPRQAERNHRIVGKLKLYGTKAV